MKEQNEKQAIEEMMQHMEDACNLATLCDFDCNRCKSNKLYSEGYRKQSEWISVDERLPDNYRAVLVACDGLTIGGYAQIAIGSYGGGFWSIADADGTMYLTKYMRCVVTHWMPLPEPPKMKGE